jgi:ferritin
MISKNMTEALNKHLNNEFYSAYLYLGMSAKCQSMGLKGAANWFMAQYNEEMDHAMRFYNYILDQGEEVELFDIKRTEIKEETLKELFEKTLEHERIVTQYINELMDLALQEKDHATMAFLQWFVTEQIEEESTVADILDQLKLVENSGNGLFMIDRELGQRQFSSNETN